ncbi:glycosyltransferase family 4 protein [Cupriavidus metallidurans]|uniref:Glycosyl transferase, group 1 n=1 Tax=Cupriavidus metallidurans (strain ATCC 43123 / DSM 2839 / NBRC 102507 / CH34) TaxID=266264 RepID=Q1LJS5_CUPMC|nr:glycosyltransferase family 4 protein [Cupriavidus metallidurans]ABF09601.1 Glycosyl transferase, group 1 [Cupriavidus metallidurans CH34]QGS29555.1 glycosyltransferase [Cupriavidus metallidurans]
MANVLVLTKYGRLGASSRLRFFQYIPWLKSAGLNVTVQALLSDDLLQKRYECGHYSIGQLLRAYSERCRVLLSRREYDVIWIEKEALQWAPLWVEAALLRGTPYVLDYDDAVFHNYDLHANAWVRRFYGRRLDGLMEGATMITAGNEYLALRARSAGARAVEIVPTVIDLDRYSLAEAARSSKDVQYIVWIGSPSTVRYLQLVAESLQELARSHKFVLRVIGGDALNIPGVCVESISWSEESEVELIGECDIGIMPLLDSPWERGKCGYKLIQYMACGLPVVASGVGVNTEIVRQGVNGYVANSAEEWRSALDKLLLSTSLRQDMGRAGRQLVEDRFCVQKTGPRLVEILQRVARTGTADPACGAREANNEV